MGNHIRAECTDSFPARLQKGGKADDLILDCGIYRAYSGRGAYRFPGGALAGLLVQVLGGSVKLQLALFAAVSFALLLLVRPLAAGILKPKETRTNTDGLIGRKVVVKETIDNVRGTGSVSLAGETWLARSLHENRILTPGTAAVIREIRGAKLFVEQENE